MMLHRKLNVPNIFRLAANYTPAPAFKSQWIVRRGSRMVQPFEFLVMLGLGLLSLLFLRSDLFSESQHVRVYPFINIRTMGVVFHHFFYIIVIHTNWL